MAREYRLLDVPGASEEFGRYAELVRHTRIGGLEYDAEARWDEFEHSREFRGLTDREQNLARRTLHYVLSEERPWHIGEDGQTDNLLGLPGPRFTVPSTPDDAMVLAGVRGWEIAEELIDDDRRTQKLLGTLGLNDYVNLAVATALYGRDDGEADLSYSVIDSPGSIVWQTVGGTFHGDFVAGWKRFATSGPSVDPMGIRRNFTPPLGGDIVRAYHSVEDTLAVGMLNYLATGSEEKLEQMKREIIETIDMADLGRGGGNFADFGTNGQSGASAIFVDDFRAHEPGDILESFTVIPGRLETRMELVAEREGVLLRNISQHKGDDGSTTKEIVGQMPIATAEIPTFIATMAAASAGRTSLAEIRAAIEHAHVWR
jgi:hypothetical protein